MSEPINMDGNTVKVLEWLRWLLPRDSFGALVGIDIVHHKIHEGDHYMAAVFDADVDMVAPKYVRITAPDTDVRVNLAYEVTANGEFLLEIFEDPTLLVAGAAVTAFNNDRNETVKVATATVFQDTTTQAPNNDGTLMPWGGYSGGDKRKASTIVGGRIEGILEQAEDYIYKVTTLADNISVNIKLAWYEH